jgi:hypothetical protein
MQMDQSFLHYLGYVRLMTSLLIADKCPRPRTQLRTKSFSSLHSDLLKIGLYQTPTTDKLIVHVSAVESRDEVGLSFDKR